MIAAEGLFMIGGCLMMLEPLLRPVAMGSGYLGAALREAFVPPSGGMRELEMLLERMP